MNAIFLDIDGVLNWKGTTNLRHKIWGIDPKLVQRLNLIFEEIPNIVVVLSSAWRFGVSRKEIDINELLEEQGYEGPKITEMTYVGNEIKPRGLEIQEWLDQHPEIDKFVILDDDDDMEHLLPHHVQTCFQDGGLKKEHVEEVIRRLS